MVNASQITSIAFIQFITVFIVIIVIDTKFMITVLKQKYIIIHDTLLINLTTTVCLTGYIIIIRHLIALCGETFFNQRTMALFRFGQYFLAAKPNPALSSRRLASVYAKHNDDEKPVCVGNSINTYDRCQKNMK